MILDAGMTQSMSRIGKCIDNGPMEDFWGMLKRERYYTRDFDSRKALVTMINNYMEYYNNGPFCSEFGPFELAQNIIATKWRHRGLYYLNYLLDGEHTKREGGGSRQG